MAIKKVTVDKNLCLGCGTCMALCPYIFTLGDDGKAEANTTVEESEVKDTVDACPVGAISLTE